MRASGTSGFVSFKIRPHIYKPQIPIKDVIISSDHFLDYHGAGLVIFTSGTSGPPKGAVKRRSFLDTNAQSIAQWYHLEEMDVILHTLPVHHATGIGMSFMPFLLAGSCIEFQSSGFNPAQIWERWKQGGLSVFSGVPTMYMRLMMYFDETVSKLPAEEAQVYIDAARSFRLMMSGSAALPFTLQSKWIKLLGGRRILERYGATEFSSVFSVRPGDSNNPDVNIPSYALLQVTKSNFIWQGSVGKVFFGLQVKLSNGDEGEVLVKSPHMFKEFVPAQFIHLSNYLQIPDTFMMRKLLQMLLLRMGFTKQEILLVARASTISSSGGLLLIVRAHGVCLTLYFLTPKVIKSGGYKISALDIEREILDLSYVGEVMVVGVDDEEYGQRVAAAITIRDHVRLSINLCLKYQ